MEIKKCNSHGGKCPCVDCLITLDEVACAGCTEMGVVDTEKLCAIAKAYCEKVNSGDMACEEPERMHEE